MHAAHEQDQATATNLVDAGNGSMTEFPCLVLKKRPISRISTFPEIGKRGGSAPATRCWSRGRSATTASPSCSRGVISTSRPRSERHPSRCGRSRRRCSPPAARGCTACATPPVAAWRPCSTRSRSRPRSAWCSRRAGYRFARRWIGAGGSSASTRCTSPTRASFVAFVSAEQADAALAAMRALPEGRDAAMGSGEVQGTNPRRVLGRTSFGGHRLIDMLVGDPLPRIC